jgi:molybdenum cofactor biosynthesis enzyme
MERRSADNWDSLKLAALAKNYMSMRREIWSGLAAQTGEKWNVVKQKVLASIIAIRNNTNFSSVCHKA